jgi:hypothetical protein
VLAIVRLWLFQALLPSRVGFSGSRRGNVPLDEWGLRAADREEQTLRNLWEYYINITKFALASALRQKCLTLHCNTWSSTNTARKALQPRQYGFASPSVPISGTKEFHSPETPEMITMRRLMCHCTLTPEPPHYVTFRHAPKMAGLWRL